MTSVRTANGVQLFAKVEIADGGAAGAVAIGICFLELLLNGGDGGGIFRTESGRKPAFDYGGSDGFHAAGSNGFDAGTPDLGVADFCSGVAENQFVEPLWRVGAEPHSDHSAHGEAAKMNAVRCVKASSKAENVFRKLLDRIRAGRGGRFSVAARVIA